MLGRAPSRNLTPSGVLMTKRFALTPLFCFLSAACATGSGSDSEGTAYPALLASMQNLEAEQKRFAATTELPQTLDFGKDGRVVVRQLALDGYPGNTYVRCRFHFQNNTGRPVLRAVISLDVLDSKGELVASQSSVCIFPTPRAIHDGTFFADELRTQTHGVHEAAGWSWRLTCRTEFLDEDEEGGGDSR